MGRIATSSGLRARFHRLLQCLAASSDIASCRRPSRDRSRTQFLRSRGSRAAGIPSDRARLSRRVSRSPAASSPPCTAAGSGRCGSTPGSARRPSPIGATAICSSRGQRPERRLRSAHADGLRLRPPAGRRRSRPGRRRHRLDRGHGAAVRRHPARAGLDVDDDQLDGDHPAGALRRGRAAQRRPAVDAVGHGSERHPQGIRRARHLHLSAAASLRIVTDIFAFCERELPNWNTISISGYHIREAGSTAAQEVAFTFANAIAYVDAARAGRPRRQLVRTAAVVLLQRPQRFPRRGGEVPGGAAAVGADHARPLRRHQPARALASHDACNFRRAARS